MIGKNFVKIWLVFLGISTEIMMTVFIMLCALGISWLISGGWR